MPHKLNQPLTNKFNEAFAMASYLHREQARKGTQIPYMSHVIAVTALVLEYGGTETQAIAALLHDAVEDCGGKPMLEQIRSQFGPEVGSIVEACSDSFDAEVKLPWRKRKEAYLEHLRNSATQAPSLLVVAADKLHNLLSVERDLQVEGRSLWKRFNAPFEDQIWYYESVVAIVGKRMRNPIVKELSDTLKTVKRKSAAIK